jgi:hypothetical protein
MRFSEFLVELDLPIPAQEPGDTLGFQKIRKVLYRYGLDLPALYDINEDGDELALELDGGLFLYVLYYSTDDGNYDFYAEVTNWDGVDKLMSDEEEPEED